jgi:transposase InsO family protein
MADIEPGNSPPSRAEQAKRLRRRVIHDAVRKADKSGKTVRLKHITVAQAKEVLRRKSTAKVKQKETKVYPERKKRYYPEPARDTIKPLSDRQEALLNRVYYKDSVMAGRDRLYDYLRQKHPDYDVTRRQLAKWLGDQYPNQVHRYFKKQTDVAPFLAKAPFKVWLADLFEPPEHSTSQRNAGADDEAYVNTGKWRYMLNVVDAFSRKAYMEPLQRKTASATWAAFKRVLKRANGVPKRLHVDRGTEFAGAFEQGLADRNIRKTVGLAGKPHGQAIVERANFTLESLFSQSRTARGSKAQKWWSKAVYQKVERTYNDMPHHALKRASPNAVESDKASWADIYADAKATAGKKRLDTTQATGKSEFSKGDTVRLADNKKRKNPLSKGANPNWSAELYEVYRVQAPGNDGFVATYKIREQDGDRDKLKGTFAGSDLQHVHAVAKGKYVDADDKRASKSTREAEQREEQAEARKSQRKLDAKESGNKEYRARKAELEGLYAGKHVFDPDHPTSRAKKATVGGASHNPQAKGGSKAWGFTVSYHDGDRFWRPLAEVKRAVATWEEADKVRPERVKTKAKASPARRSTRLRKRQRDV